MQIVKNTTILYEPKRHSLLGNSHKQIKPRKLLLARLTL